MDFVGHALAEGVSDSEGEGVSEALGAKTQSAI